MSKGIRGLWANASKWGKVTIIATGVIAIFIALGAIFGEGDTSDQTEESATPVEHASPENEPQQPSPPSPASKPEQKAPRAKASQPQKSKPSPAVLQIQAEEHAQVELEDSVKDVVDSAEVACGFFGGGRVTCGVTYEIDDLVGIDTDEELLNAQRDVWETLFANPRFKEGFVELEAPVETVGGKESVASVLRVRCNRAAARQIDWDNVQSDGMKQLCQWDQLIG